MGIQFGDYTYICDTVALIVCPLLGGPNGLAPSCYSRNVEVSNTLIFQPATDFVHIVAIFMTGIMIYHIKSKYTAVGRKEIVMFFYLYMLTTFIQLCLDSGIIPTASNVYKYFAAIHTGLVSATLWCLLLNGFVGFQFAEDGTAMSLWSIRISSTVIFLLGFVIAYFTFQNTSPFSNSKPIALFCLQFIFNAACIIIYIILQVVLVLNTLDDRWPLGDILFGVTFFVIGQVIIYAFSIQICDTVKHYIDGLFFGTICTLLSVMMIYKYWDSITKEDLEFSVGSKQNVWEVKELLGEDEMSEYGGVGNRATQYGGYPPQQGYGYNTYDDRY